MASQLIAASSPTTTAAASNGTTTTCTSPISTATTVFSLSEDDLHEIFLRLPDLPTLVRAALTCRPWLRAVRSSPPFRLLFGVLHQAPLIGLFFKIGNASSASFLPPSRFSPVVTATLRRGNFSLTSLPPSSTGWRLVDYREGYVLLWNNSPDRPSLAAVNPMTWAINVLPSLPGQISAGRRRGFAVFSFHLLPSDESPRSFRLACVCVDKLRVRVAVFSSETREWDIRPWVYAGANCSLKFMAGTLVGGSVFWPYHAKPRMIRIDTATTGVSFVDLPTLVEEAAGHNFGVGETGNGELCIVHESNFSLHVWIRRRSVEDGTEVWAPPTTHSLGAEIDRVTQALALNDVQLHLRILQVRSGLVHLSVTTCTTRAGTPHCWFFSLSLETVELELLLEGRFDGVDHLYNMAWPPSLVGDEDETIRHE